MKDLENLKHLLEHWIEHNNDHVKTYEEWASKAESLGQKDLGGILKQIAEETKKQEGLFNKALEII